MALYLGFLGTNCVVIEFNWEQDIEDPFQMEGIHSMIIVSKKIHM